MSGVPAHVRAPLTRGDVLRLLRAASTPGHVAVMLTPGTLPPEVDGAGSWSTAGGVRIAGVPRVRALEVARARAEAAATQLASDPPSGAAWCLVLESGVRCAVVPFPVEAPSEGV